MDTKTLRYLKRKKDETNKIYKEGIHYFLRELLIIYE